MLNVKWCQIINPKLINTKMSLSACLGMYQFCPQASSNKIALIPL